MSPVSYFLFLSDVQTAGQIQHLTGDKAGFLTGEVSNSSAELIVGADTANGNQVLDGSRVKMLGATGRMIVNDAAGGDAVDSDAGTGKLTSHAVGHVDDACAGDAVAHLLTGEAVLSTGAGHENDTTGLALLQERQGSLSHLE